MFCPNCGNVLPEGSAFCNKCGYQLNAAPANQSSNQGNPPVNGKIVPPVQPNNSGNKKNKHGALKVIAAIVVLFFALGIAAAIFGGNSSSSSKNEKTASAASSAVSSAVQEATASAAAEVTTASAVTSETAAETTEKAAAAATSEAPKTKAYKKDLAAGNYTAGIDIPAGKYDCEGKSGTGNVSSDNMYMGGLNEIMGTDTSMGAQKSFKGCILDEGTVLSIGGNVVLHVSCKKADVSGMKPRGEDKSSKQSLAAGNYTAGDDFPAGIYDIIATGSAGNVSSDNMFEGGLNEIMGTSDDGMSISKFRNADLPV